MAKPKTLKGKVIAYLKKNKVKIIATAILFVVAIILLLVPYFAVYSSTRPSDKFTSETREIEKEFRKQNVSTIEDAKRILKEKNLDVAVRKDGSCFAWNQTNNTVYLKKGILTPSQRLSCFNYLTGDYTIGYEADDSACYLLTPFTTITEDLHKIFTQREKANGFTSTGMALDFVEFAYQNTLFIDQVSTFGFTTYLANRIPASTETNMVAIFGDVDMDRIDGSYAQTSFSLLKSLLFHTREIIFTNKTQSIKGEIFRTCLDLQRFVLDHNHVFKIENNALIQNNTIIAYPAACMEKEIVISSSIQKIEEGAFYGATPSKMILPFVGLSRGSFFGEFGLFGYIFGKSDEGMAQIVGNTYLKYAIPSTLREIVVTDETKISKGAFSGMEYLEKLTLNEGIETVENYAFDRCNSITELIIPKSVTFFHITKDNSLRSLNKLYLYKDFKLDDFNHFTNKTITNDLVIYSR